MFRFAHPYFLAVKICQEFLRNFQLDIFLRQEADRHSACRFPLSPFLCTIVRLGDQGCIGKEEELNMCVGYLIEPGVEEGRN